MWEYDKTYSLHLSNLLVSQEYGASFSYFGKGDLFQIRLLSPLQQVYSGIWDTRWKLMPSEEDTWSTRYEELVHYESAESIFPAFVVKIN